MASQRLLGLVLVWGGRLWLSVGLGDAIRPWREGGMVVRAHRPPPSVFTKLPLTEQVRRSLVTAPLVVTSHTRYNNVANITYFIPHLSISCTHATSFAISS